MATDERTRNEYRALESYEGYTVYDQHGEKIGKVDDLFVDEDNRPEYIGVRTGFFRMSSTLVPMEIARVYDRNKSIDVSEDKDRVKAGPNFDYDDEITPEFEARVLGHFGLSSSTARESRGSYGDYYSDSAPGEGRSSEAYGQAEGTETVPVREERENEEREEPSEGSRERAGAASAVTPERTEGERRGNEPHGLSGEELRERPGEETHSTTEVEREEPGPRTAEGAREERTGTETEDRQTEGLRIRKRSRAEREVDHEGGRQQMQVPVKKEKARVERVPNEEGGEELRVRKEVVEEQETVEIEDRGERTE